MVGSHYTRSILALSVDFMLVVSHFHLSKRMIMKVEQNVVSVSFPDPHVLPSRSSPKQLPNPITLHWYFQLCIHGLPYSYNQRRQFRRNSKWLNASKSR